MGDGAGDEVMLSVTSWFVVPLLQGGDVPETSFPALGQPAGSNCFCDLHCFFVGEEDVCLAFDVFGVSGVDDIGRHGGFELDFAPEPYDGEESVVVYLEILGERLGVSIVLAQWVLHSSLIPVSADCPLCVSFISEYPAVDIF